MLIDVDKIFYAVLGGVSLILVQHLYRRLHARVSGRDLLLKYSTVIKRHARLCREVERTMRENKNIRSIILQGVDAAYITLAGREPSVAVLHLRKNDDAVLFRRCLNLLHDPKAVYALATEQRTHGAAKVSTCTEFKDYAPPTENTWFRFAHGREGTDEKVDDAMLEQLLSLASSHDGNLTQSGSCHIALRRRNAEGNVDIIVTPTSFEFRKAFKKEYGSDDLTCYGANDMFEKLLKTRQALAAHS